MKCVVTGGLGFFGTVLCEWLLDHGHEVISIDWLATEPKANYQNIIADIGDRTAVDLAFDSIGPVDVVFHVAAVLAHIKESLPKLWRSNVDGTENVLEMCRKHKVPKCIFVSTNCIYSSGYPQPVTEETAPGPIEIYGKSKLEAEKVLAQFDDLNTVVIRCPTIISAGRLGLLTILFDFIREGRRVYMVGDGSNRYSFIYAPDLANACLMAAESNATGTFNAGSDNVPTMRELYTSLYERAGKKPRLVCVPEGPTVLALKIAHKLGISPLGPYHYRMLAANFVFDNSKMKRTLNWKPTKTNSDMLGEAYQFYVDNIDEINSAQGQSPHHSKAKAGILNLLRYIS